MRIQELIRGILDMLDGSQELESTTIVVAHPTATIDQPEDASPFTHAGDDINRWRQIVDLADNDGCEPYGNTPKERVASIDAVTTDAGGGVNGPKHPHDLRVKDPSMYPNQQEI
jgi:hypothetical protein